MTRGPTKGASLDELPVHVHKTRETVYWSLTVTPVTVKIGIVKTFVKENRKWDSRCQKKIILISCTCR